MTNLDHSMRSMQRATYAPIKLPSDHPHPQIGRAVDKWVFAAALAPTLKEYVEAKRRILQGAGAVPQVQRKHLETLQAVFAALEAKQSAAVILENIPKFNGIPASLILRVGEELLKIRKEDFQEAAVTLKAISAAYEKAATKESIPQRAKIPEGYQLNTTYINPNLPGAKLYRKELKRTVLTKETAAAKAETVGRKSASSTEGVRYR